MRVIGVRELKAHLSRALRDVQAGDVILVTDRGRVVAELRQPTTTGASDSDRALGRLAGTGLLRIGEAHNKAAYVASPVKGKRGLAKKLLDESRSEP